MKAVINRSKANGVNIMIIEVPNVKGGYHITPKDILLDQIWKNNQWTR